MAASHRSTAVTLQPCFGARIHPTFRFLFRRPARRGDELPHTIRACENANPRESSRGNAVMDLLLIGGASGSGKSVALAALEDSGYYAVSLLPVSQLHGLLAHLKAAGQSRVAIALDVKTEHGLASLPAAMADAQSEGWTVRFLYLDAKNDTLVKRFSETRRRHPFSSEARTLREAIVHERALFTEVRNLGYSFDTSDLSAAALRAWIKD